MRRLAALMIFLIFVLGLVLATGCSDAPPPVNPKLGPLLDAEIATLGSAAKCPGPRSIAQIASLTADVTKAQKHRAEGWR